MIVTQCVGRLTKEPQLRYTSQETPVVNFTVACKRSHPNKAGQIPTTFLNCVLWGKPAEVLAEYAQKGHMIAVQGELQNRKFDDQQGRTHYLLELLIESFEFLAAKKEETQQVAKESETGFIQKD